MKTGRTLPSIAGLALMTTIATGAAAATPMTFEVVTQGHPPSGAGVSAAIYAVGDITEGTAARFEQAIARGGVTDAVVYFDSGGGVVLESVRLGQIIRKLSFATSVDRQGGPSTTAKAMCASACVYAYAGGIARYLDDAKGRLGVHQYAFGPGEAQTVASGVNEDIKIAQLLGSVIVAHLHQMGISSALYVAAAMTDSKKMLWMTKAEASTFDLVNDGILAPTADIRLTDAGKPYLRITQIADRGETHVSITCDAGRITFGADATGDGASLRRVLSQAVRNHVVIDGRTVYTAPGKIGLKDIEEGVASAHDLTPASLDAIDAAETLGMSVDGIGGRWSRSIAVSTLRDRIAYYTRICRPSSMGATP